MPIKERKELVSLCDILTSQIPKDAIVGPLFCIFQFVSNGEGFDVEVGFPVSRAIETSDIKTRLLHQLDVLSIFHNGPVKKIHESFSKIITFTSEHSMSSDEFYREIYHGSNNPLSESVEVQFVIHDWNKLLTEGLTRNLSDEIIKEIMKDSESLTIESSSDERFHWIKNVIEKIDTLIDDERKKYDIISNCAHIFPSSMTQKLNKIYKKTKMKSRDTLEAVDAVLDYMKTSKSIYELPIRQGNIIIAAKNPANPDAFQKATSPEEKRKAYCYCPHIRNYLDRGISVSYCYCGSGWFRRQ